MFDRLITILFAFFARPATPTVLAPIANPQVNITLLRCAICRDTLDVPNADGDIETSYILPCSHTFGGTCIKRWLQASPNHNCPICRCSMLYTICGHPIRPLEASAVGEAYDVKNLPDRCQLCRQDGIWRQRVELLESNQLLEQKILAGLGSFLATDCIDVGKGQVGGVERRVEESRQRFENDWQDLRVCLENDIGKRW